MKMPLPVVAGDDVAVVRGGAADGVAGGGVEFQAVAAVAGERGPIQPQADVVAGDERVPAAVERDAGAEGVDEPQRAEGRAGRGGTEEEAAEMVEIDLDASACPRSPGRSCRRYPRCPVIAGRAPVVSWIVPATLKLMRSAPAWAFAFRIA